MTPQTGVAVSAAPPFASPPSSPNPLPMWLRVPRLIACTGIRNRRPVDMGPRRDLLRPVTGRTHNIDHIDTPHQKRIPHQRAMTPPGHRLGTHDRGGGISCDADQCTQCLLEFPGLHMIRIPPKRHVPPGRVDRIRRGLSPATEPRQPLVGNIHITQAFRQGIVPVLWIVTRLRDRADIHQRLHPVSLQEIDELLDWSR